MVNLHVSFRLDCYVAPQPYRKLHVSLSSSNTSYGRIPGKNLHVDVTPGNLDLRSFTLLTKQQDCHW